MLKFVEFKTTDHNLAAAFARLKYSVFVEEYGWYLPSTNDERALIDDNDRLGQFVGALDEGMVGSVRSVFLDKARPFFELIEGHFKQGKFKQVPMSNIILLTSLAVLDKYRGRKFLIDGSNVETTIAEEMIETILESMKQKGAKLAITNASTDIAFSFFVKTGFRVMDYPVYHAKHPYPIVNLIRNLSDKKSVEFECLENYINSREKFILKGQTPKRWIINQTRIDKDQGYERVNHV